MNAVFHLSIIWISGKIRFPSMLNRTTIGYERDKFLNKTPCKLKAKSNDKTG